MEAIKRHHVTETESGRVVFLRCIRCGKEGVDLAVVSGKVRGVCMDCVREPAQVANWWRGRAE